MVSFDSLQKYVGDAIIFDVWLRIFDTNDPLASFSGHTNPTPLSHIVNARVDKGSLKQTTEALTM